MTYQKEIKKVTRQFLIILLLLLVVSYIITTWTIKKVEHQLYQDTSRIVENLILKYPSEEEEIINNLLNPDKVENNILEKYGIDGKVLMEKEVKSLKQKIYFDEFVIFSVIVIAITIIYVRNLFHIYKKIDYINLYVKDVLNGKATFNIKEYEEGTFSSLKNDMYKLTNRLKEQNDQMIKDKKYLEATLSDISHQLKTPLTSMYMINDLLKDEHLDPKVKNEFLNKERAQLERIEWLVTSLLKLSRLESGMITLKKEQVKVIDLLKKAMEPLQILIELKNLKITYKGNMNTMIVCDFLWTIEALVNILKNAVEHTSKEGTIQIAFQDNPLYVMIRIIDNGEGITKEDLPHIFERFYKGKHNHKESIGIGLNMAKNIIDRQNGSIMATSIIKEGTEFTIQFYKNETI